MVFHVLNRAAKRTLLFHNASDYFAFEDLLEEAVERIDVALFAYCVMPNHWHLVVAPKTDGALSRFMHWLTTTHARRWQNAHGVAGLGAVYQGRFKAIPIARDPHFLWVCRYVKRNPLRAALVEYAEEWRWSSLHTRTSPWLAEWPVPRPADWLTHVNSMQTEGELERFRDAVRNGRPFGDAKWMEEISREGHTWQCGVPGRPCRRTSPTVLQK